MRKKNVKKKLSSLVFVLFLTVIMLSTSTYAWFTSNQLVKINSLNVNVSASEGFQISVDGVNWKSIINTSDILGVTYSGSANQIPTAMVPVSTATMTSTTDGRMEMFVGTVTTDVNTGEYVLEAAAGTETTGQNGSYAAFDLYFRTNNAINLVLEPDAGVTDIASVANRRDRGMENSARVAFVKQGHIDTSVTVNPTPGAIQGLAYLDNDGDNITIWEPNYMSHTDESKIEAYNMYGIVTTSPIYGGRIPYWGIKAVIPTLTPVKLSDAFAPTAPSTYFGDIDTRVPSGPTGRYITTAKENMANDISTNTNITIDSGITKMRIYMWLEGQDIDCGDSASGSDIAFDLVLSADRVAIP